MEDVYTVEIIGWKKVNARGDVTNAAWFKMYNKLAFDPEWAHFTAEELWCWVFLLSFASIKSRPLIALSDKTFGAYARVPLTVVSSVKQKLTKISAVRLRNGDVTATYRRRVLDRGEREEGGEKKERNTSHPLIQIWNSHRGQLPECRGCSGKRKQSADARWSEKTSTEYWTEIVIRMAKSAFCRGEKSTGDHANWKATFDFLIQPDTQFRVLEGKYDDRAGLKAPEPFDFNAERERLRLKAEAEESESA